MDVCNSQLKIKMNTKNKSIIANFIEEIWNQQLLDNISHYIADGYVDHSLPPSFPINMEGTKLWIIETGKSFKHHTTIEEMLCENDKVMLKIRMHLIHIGSSRNIEPTSLEISTIGYRFYKMSEGKIIEHWSLLDGNSIENQLRDAKHGCKIQE